ncbi:MAG: putative toxin-antitoxin system toxin component, PIN family [Chitinophagales bacterium]
MPLKIVIDTNIWVSYFINARADYLIKWVTDRSLIVYTSNELAEELEEVLSRPKFKKQFPFSTSDFISLHLRISELVKTIPQYHLAPDPNDNFLFDLCKKVNADYLVTSDKKLLNYFPDFQLEIISFNELRSRI